MDKIETKIKDLTREGYSLVEISEITNTNYWTITHISQRMKKEGKLTNEDINKKRKNARIRKLL